MVKSLIKEEAKTRLKMLPILFLDLLLHKLSLV